jgi:hypothetical protein
METNPRCRAVSASLGRFVVRVLVFVLVAASALTFASAAARAEGVANTEVGPPFADAIRDRQTSWARWEVKEAVIAAAKAPESPQVRDQLVPVLVAAHERNASGYDRLRAAVCTGCETMSADRVRACTTLPAGLEDGWRRRDRIETWVVGGVVTAAYAGAIAATIIERDGDTGRGVATAAGVPIGTLTGIIAVAGATRPVFASSDEKGGSYSTGQKILAASVAVGGAIAGGVIGGWVAHSLADSPGARVTVTAVALTPMYLATLVIIDW